MDLAPQVQTCTRACLDLAPQVQTWRVLVWTCPKHGGPNWSYFVFCGLAHIAENLRRPLRFVAHGHLIYHILVSRLGFTVSFLSRLHNVFVPSCYYTYLYRYYLPLLLHQLLQLARSKDTLLVPSRSQWVAVCSAKLSTIRISRLPNTSKYVRTYYYNLLTTNY